MIDGYSTGVRIQIVGTVQFGNYSSNTSQEVKGVTSIPLNVWTHVAATFNSGQVVIYVNGVADKSSSISFTSLNHVNWC